MPDLNYRQDHRRRERVGERDATSRMLTLDAKYPPDPEYVVWLVERACDGDDSARNELALLHLPLVRGLASRVCFKLGITQGNADYEDAFQTGVLAMLTCVAGFDSGLGKPFGAYCAGRVRGAMFDYLRNMRSPVTIKGAMRSNLKRVLARAGGDAEVAGRRSGGMSGDTFMARLGEQERGIHSVPLRTDDRITESTPDGALMAMRDAQARAITIQRLRERLDYDELCVLDWLLLADPPLTLEKAGRRLDISTGTVSRIRNRVLGVAAEVFGEQDG